MEMDLNLRKERLINAINKYSNVTVLGTEQLMETNRLNCDVILKGAKRTKISSQEQMYTINEDSSKYSDEIIDLIYEIYSISKEEVFNARVISDYIKESLKNEDYRYSLLVKELLAALKELDFEINNTKDDAFWYGKYEFKKYSKENQVFLDTIDSGIKVLTIGGKEEKKAA